MVDVPKAKDEVEADAQLNGWENGSVIKAESLVNHESFTDDDAIVETNPFVPVNAKPCVKLER